jgi:hypothetical protein
MCDDGACPTDRTVSVAPSSTTVVSMALPEVKSRIVAELRQSWMRQLVFRCGETVVDYTQYGRVACAIASDRIHVDVSREDIAGSACYSPYEMGSDEAPFLLNTLYLRPHFAFGSIRQVGLVVHEATHAIQDIQGRRMIRREAECAAYTAQSFYCFVRGTTLRAVMDENRAAGGASTPGGDALIDAADAAAGRMFRDPANAIINHTEMSALRDAVTHIGLYSHNWRSGMHFDGL